MIKFSNSIYKGEHHQQPRGLGKWGFYVPIKDATLTSLECPFEHYHVEAYSGRFCIVWASKVMTLTEAKKEIESWFTSKGLTNGTIFIAD